MRRALPFFLVVLLLFSCTEKEEDPYIHPSKGEGKSVELPHLCIDTPSLVGIKSKTEWIEGATVRLVLPDGKVTALGSARVKGRGNTTWTYPKKPYAMKLESEAAILGMPADVRWDLLANYMDRTDMRNAVALEVARRTKSLEWTPHGVFVELYLNSEWQGNYFLCEHVKIDKNRLDLHKGGYLLELDTKFDEEFKFRSALLNLPVQVKDWKGDEMTQGHLGEIMEEFNDVEAIIASDGTPGGGWQDVLDMDTFIDWWLAEELVQCGESSHPKSCYMYRDKGGKLKAGPVWDFDWGTFRSGGEVTAFRNKNSIFYRYLFKDPAFVKRVKEKWEESKADFLSVTEYIDKTAAQIKASVEKDKTKCPMTTTTNKDESMTFDLAVATMRSNYKMHWEWLDGQISGM